MRLYVSKGEPRVEVWDEVSTVDLSWEQWELAVNAASVGFAHWALTHSLEYSAWLERVGRTNSRHPTRSRWPWRR
jgi:hypothetical protein